MVGDELLRFESQIVIVATGLVEVGLPIAVGRNLDRFGKDRVDTFLTSFHDSTIVESTLINRTQHNSAKKMAEEDHQTPKNWWDDIFANIP